MKQVLSMASNDWRRTSLLAGQFGILRQHIGSLANQRPDIHDFQEKTLIDSNGFFLLRLPKTAAHENLILT